MRQHAARVLRHHQHRGATHSIWHIWPLSFLGVEQLAQLSCSSGMWCYSGTYSSKTFLENKSMLEGCLEEQIFRPSRASLCVCLGPPQPEEVPRLGQMSDCPLAVRPSSGRMPHVGKGQMGSALTGSLQISYFVDRDFWGTPVNLLWYYQKCQGVPMFPIWQTNVYFCSCPISADPICLPTNIWTACPRSIAVCRTRATHSHSYTHTHERKESLRHIADV